MIGPCEDDWASTREVHGEPRQGGRMGVHEVPWSCEWDVGGGLAWDRRGLSGREGPDEDSPALHRSDVRSMDGEV